MDLNLSGLTIILFSRNSFVFQLYKSQTDINKMLQSPGTTYWYLGIYKNTILEQINWNKLHGRNYQKKKILKENRKVKQ